MSAYGDLAYIKLQTLDKSTVWGALEIELTYKGYLVASLGINSEPSYSLARVLILPKGRKILQNSQDGGDRATHMGVLYVISLCATLEVTTDSNIGNFVHVAET